MAEEALDWRIVADSDRHSLQGRKIAIRGKFDHSKGNSTVTTIALYMNKLIQRRPSETEILLGPRPPPVGVFGPAAQGLATNPMVIIALLRYERSQILLETERC